MIETEQSDSSPAFFDESSIGQVLYFSESESVLWISQVHAYQPHVRMAKQRYQSRSGGRPIKVEYVSMDVIHEKRLKGEAATQSFGGASEMQRAASELFVDAVKGKASDIHIRIDKTRTDVCYRINNDLVRVVQHPVGWGKSLCQTIYHTMTDVSDATFEEGNCQDARIGNRQYLPEGLTGIRVATVPAVDGYAMVLRLLYDASGASLDLHELGFTDVQKKMVHLMMRRPTGINLVTGPTGSGKSTTLQRVLTKLIQDTRGTKNVITVEDPPEYPIPGAIQSPVTNATSVEERTVAFQKAIKGAMRADPDVIMVGEIRDSASAKLALEAAMTGHQVWSTLHANSAFHIIDRLVDLGIPIDLVTDPYIMGGMSSQRLMKTLCSCKKKLASVVLERTETDPSFAEEAERMRALFGADFDQIHVVGDGCPLCRHTGIRSREAVVEVVVPDEEMMRMIKSHDTPAAIQYWKSHHQGMSMLEHTLLKVRQGRLDPFQAESTIGPLDEGKSLFKPHQTGAAGNFSLVGLPPMANFSEVFQ